MSQSSNDRLQFSINESVWLRDDAPAEEILSMALEPDITVEENWNDVTIKGFLRLTGEFRPAEISADAANDAENQTAPFRTIDEIMETGSGTDTLEHHFPIDITIPADRVPNLENLFVVIDSFDYELSEHRHIQLQADIAITGLTNNDQVDRTEKPKESAKAPIKAPVQKPAPAAKPAIKEKAEKPEKALKPAKEAPVNKAEKANKPTIEAQAEKPAAEKPAQKKEVAPEKEIASKKEIATKKEAAPVPKKEMASKKEEKPVKAESKKKPATKGKRLMNSELPLGDADFASDFDEMPIDRLGDEENPDFQYEAFRNPDFENEEDSAPLVAFKGIDGTETIDRSEAAQPAQSAPEAAQQQSAPPVAKNAQEAEPETTEAEKEAKAPEATSLYLTKVLAGEEEEQKSRLKICIVQSGESLESISERYHVPVTTLLRKNELTTGEIEPGELLYIPKSTKAAKDE
ncbi:MAG: stage sporulation protein [Sporolactobacillus laevolacticus]|jgi:stage VI sporulation protein D|nr:stage sporulation protein [Sporolactobacillus laevolacticus]